MFVGVLVYALRNGMGPVAYAGTLNFLLGGLGFASMHFFRAMVLNPSNSDLLQSVGVTSSMWNHFRSANWHSILEQSQGFALGVATAFTMSAIWSKVAVLKDDSPARRWTDVFAIGFVVCLLTYMNVFKNVAEWTRSEHPLVPEVMKAPLFEFIELSATTWFNLTWLGMTTVFLSMMIIHQRRTLAVVPASWLGRVQIIYCLVLWIMVIANFERALTRFTEVRLVTEWVIIMNATLATFLMLVLPGPSRAVEPGTPASYGKLVARVWVVGLPCLALILSLYAVIMFRVYGKAENSGAQYRWGNQAVWRVKPLLKNREHR